MSQGSLMSYYFLEIPREFEKIVLNYTVEDILKMLIEVKGFLPDYKYLDLIQYVLIILENKKSIKIR